MRSINKCSALTSNCRAVHPSSENPEPWQRTWIGEAEESGPTTHYRPQLHTSPSSQALTGIRESEMSAFLREWDTCGLKKPCWYQESQFTGSNWLWLQDLLTCEGHSAPLITPCTKGHCLGVPASPPALPHFHQTNPAALTPGHQLAVPKHPDSRHLLGQESLQ